MANGKEDFRVGFSRDQEYRRLFVISVRRA